MVSCKRLFSALLHPRFPYFGKKETADVVTHISGSGINPFQTTAATVGMNFTPFLSASPEEHHSGMSLPRHSLCGHVITAGSDLSTKSLARFYGNCRYFM
jgi:hypothetical protein